MKKTNYLTLDKDNQSNKPKQTKFQLLVNSDMTINILWIGKDEDYGDVFKCWDDGNENNFTIYLFWC